MSTSTSKKRRMFISVLPDEQIEMALTKDGTVQEYYVEMLQQAKTKRNIYKGIVKNIDPSLQAAFIDYGEERNGFLQVDEVHPEYYQPDVKAAKGYKYPLLQKALKPGQELLVQVGKEPTGNKGAFLTTYLSLPGRYFVLTPGREQLGVSRKIEDEKERARLKSLMSELKLDEGVGVILRTVSSDQNKTSLSRDLQFLKRLWEEVRKKGVSGKAPCLIYEEKDLAFRAVRDYLTPEVSEIWVDHAETAKQVLDFVRLAYPRRKRMVKKHLDTDKMLFDRFNLLRQLETVFERKVALPGGGEVVFDQTEALMAVDINSGKMSSDSGFKDLALNVNLEAAECIPQQLQLRDVGGQIVIDFIEMKDHKHKREVEKTLRAALKNDKARTTVGRISQFGLLEMVRQRMGSSALSLSIEDCAVCQGTGSVRSLEWRALQAMKEIFRQVRSKKSPEAVEYKTDTELAFYLLNQKRKKIEEFETQFNKQVVIQGQ
ncbi:MAG: Rne/Rng family ribonuclease [Desulfohalobiaceae bacterium]|nr:Rne/Rng family ribonuclease [Desulfohalobiaceae bacterium]